MRLHEALQTLGLTYQQVVRELDEVPESNDAWDIRNRKYQSLISTARKNALRTIHPDICADADSTERSQKINVIADALLELKVVPRVRVQQPYNVVYTYTTCTSCVDVYTTSATTSTGLF